MAIGIDFFNFLTKILINKRATSSSKATYEEFGDFTVNVSNDEIWAQSIDSTPATAVSNGVAQQYTLFVMTEDITVANQQAYYADSGGRLKDWISDKYGSDYEASLFDNNDNQIFPTDAVGWFFNYQTGILTFENSTASFAKPFKISGYRYIGTKGIATLNDIDGGSFLDTYNDTTNIDAGAF
jgi:hypothetical protein